MISSAAYAVVFWTLAQAGAPDAGTPAAVPSAESHPMQSADAGSLAADAGVAPDPAPAPAAGDPASATTDAGVPAPAPAPAPQEVGPTSADPSAVPEAPFSAPKVEEKQQAASRRAPPPASKPKAKIAHPNTATFNAAAAFFGIYSIALERTLVPHFSLVLEAGVINRNFQTPRGTTTVQGFGFAFSARYFPLGTGPDGLYVGPEVAGYNVGIREAVSRDSGTVFAVGLWAGYNFTFFDWLHVAPGVGGNLVLGQLGLHRISYGAFTLAPLVRLNVGFAF